MMGRTRDNRIVNLTGPESLSGTLAPVRIVGATATCLLGELLTKNAFINSQREGEMA